MGLKKKLQDAVTPQYAKDAKKKSDAAVQANKELKKAFNPPKLIDSQLAAELAAIKRQRR